MDKTRKKYPPWSNPDPEKQMSHFLDINDEKARLCTNHSD